MMTVGEFVAWLDDLSDEHGGDNVMVTTLRRSGKLVLMEVEPGHAARISVIVDFRGQHLTNTRPPR